MSMSMDFTSFSVMSAQYGRISFAAVVSANEVSAFLIEKTCLLVTK